MLNPKSVAVIEAAENPQSVERALMENLKSFRGRVYPVNPKRTGVLGLKAFSRVGDVPGPVDLALIATPAIAVPDVVGKCAEAGVKGAVIISAGFRECGAVGLKLEEAILARRGKMRLIGPNCLGVMFPQQGLNATIARTMALPGNVAFPIFWGREIGAARRARTTDPNLFQRLRPRDRDRRHQRGARN